MINNKTRVLQNFTTIFTTNFLSTACVQVDVTCVRLHPEADLEDTLANNVAVLKLDPASAYLPQPKDEDRLSVRDLVGLRDSYSSAIVPELVSGRLDCFFNLDILASSSSS